MIGRFLPCVLAVALAACAEPPPPPPVPAPLTEPTDTVLDVEGQAVAVTVRRGSAPLTIVFEAGGGAGAAAWDSTLAALATRTDAWLVAYDRAGFGGSALGPADLTPRAQVDLLVRALTLLGAPAPRIVVGHSYGGMLALLHAGAYPQDVASLVLVDPMNAGFIQATGDFVQSSVPAIANPETDEERAVMRMKTTLDDLVAETQPLAASLTQPITVITAGVGWWGDVEVDAAWRASHVTLAEGEGRELLIAEGARHDIPRTHASLLLDAILHAETRSR